MTDETTGKRRWPLYSDDELDSIPPPSWLVNGIITDGLTVLVGDPGAAKTFVALDWALSIASGDSWGGLWVRRRNTLYVTGEGTAGIPARRRAWRKHREVSTAGFFCIPHPVNLLDPDDSEGLSEDVHTTDAGLLVIDTLARSMAGDENSAQDMGAFVASLDRIRSERSCAALVVHHTGVEGSRPRGSTALRGAADTLIHASLDDQGEVELACWKQKDAIPFNRTRLRLAPMGESCVLMPSPVPPQRGYRAA